MSTLALPPQVRVFVRDWLSANHVLLKSRDGHVLVDSGYSRHVPLTLALLRSAQALGDEPLAALVNTHCHSDHMGGNAAISKAYGCPVSIPEGEAPHIAAWDEVQLLLGYAGQYADRFEPTGSLRAGDSATWGDLEWRFLAAPGHDMGALMFYNPEHGILISGDALWEYGFGLVMPLEIDPTALPATRATLDVIAGLDVHLIIPGHGEPFTDVPAALDRAYRRLSAFERAPERLATHAVKVIFAFLLLDRQPLPLAELPATIQAVPLLREFNERFLRRPADELARWLARELDTVGAARVEHESLIPCARS